MKSRPTPHVATARTTEELHVSFGPSGGAQHNVTVPAGTLCRKLDGGSSPWVVSDLSFIEDARSFLYHDADIYGIRIPEDKLVDIEPVIRASRPQMR